MYLGFLSFGKVPDKSLFIVLKSDGLTLLGRTFCPLESAGGSAGFQEWQVGFRRNVDHGLVIQAALLTHP